ncbi:TPA: hypothetical protein ACFRHA_002322 [Neisseria subflava]
MEYSNGVPIIWVFIAFYAGIYYEKDGVKGAIWACLRAIAFVLFIVFVVIFLFFIIAAIQSVI